MKYCIDMVDIADLDETVSSLLLPPIQTLLLLWCKACL